MQLEFQGVVTPDVTPDVTPQPDPTPETPGIPATAGRSLLSGFV